MYLDLVTTSLLSMMILGVMISFGCGKKKKGKTTGGKRIPAQEPPKGNPPPKYTSLSGNKNNVGPMPEEDPDLDSEKLK